MFQRVKSCVAASMWYRVWQPSGCRGIPHWAFTGQKILLQL